MKYHKQRFLHRPEVGQIGDCHRTVLACLLDLEPEEVPHVGPEHLGNGDLFHEHFEDFLSTKGLRTISFAFQGYDLDAVLTSNGFYNPGILCILGGTSANDLTHSVVVCGNKIIWDPSLDNSGIVGPIGDCYWVTYFTPISFVGGDNINEN